MRSFILPFILVLAPAVAPAQADTATATDSNDLKAGAEVRITTRVGRIFYGRLDRLSADSVRIRTSGANDYTVVAAIPRDSVARFEVNHPGSPRTGRGVLAGLAVGGLAGVLLDYSESMCLFCTPQEQQQSAAAGNSALALSLVVGGVVGGLVGSKIRSAHWQEVSADRLRVTVRPAGGGVGLGLTVRF